MSSATILIVEDDAVFRELLTTILDEAGYTVATACDGGEGLRRLQREHFDLVLSDLKMPVRSGLDLFRTIRSEPNAPLFIFITAFGRVDEAVAAIKEGAFKYRERRPSARRCGSSGATGARWPRLSAHRSGRCSIA
jgi:CheY-like chemotaxis protein